MSEARAIGGRILTGPFIAGLAIAGLAFYFLGQRFLYGLGYMTAMNDGYPWGVWITIDVVIGTAFGCGGYAMALLVYVFNKGQYHPLVRPAVLAGALGYTMAGVSVFVDIGRYWNIYHVFMPKYTNFNSVLLEVALCVATYVAVCWIEFMPAFLEKFGAESVKATLNRLLFFFIAVGVLLPTMHQSSLGSLMILAGVKLSPLWQTPLLPLLYLISALFMGFGVVIFESSLSGVGFKLADETPLLGKLAALIPKFVSVFLFFRISDILMRGALGHAFHFDLKGNMFLLEILLHLIPIYLLSSEKSRESARVLFLSAVSLLAGGTLFRLNSYIIGFDPGQGWHYFPSAQEMMVTFGFISLEIVIYLFVVKKFPVLPAHKHA